MLEALKRLFVGRPLATTQMEEQRLPKTIALAVFSSDALSSTAYATEEILFVVAVGASSLALGLSKLVPIAIVVAVLLAIVIVSYRQVIFAYPNGGRRLRREQGEHRRDAVARRRRLADGRLRAHRGGVDLRRRRRDHLDTRRSAGLADASGRARRRADRADHADEHARGQGVGTDLRHPDLRVHADLRRADRRTACASRSSATSARCRTTPKLAETSARSGGTLTLFLLLKGFSSGAVALTGVEAISNGVPAFRRPESKNAAATLVWMGVLLGTLFFGISILAHRLAALPEPRPHRDRAARPAGVRQRADVRLPAVRDRDDPRAGREHRVQRVPEPLVDHRLRRLPAAPARRTAATGSCSRTASSCWPVPPRCSCVAFGGITNALIPLYAVGVFTSFTLSQSGMVRHHLKLREPHWRRSVGAQRRRGDGDVRRPADRRDHEVHERRVGADRRDPRDRAPVQGDQAALHDDGRAPAGATRLHAAQEAAHRRRAGRGRDAGALEALAYAHLDRARPLRGGDGRGRRSPTRSRSRRSGRSTAITVPLEIVQHTDRRLHRRDARATSTRSSTAGTTTSSTCSSPSSSCSTGGGTCSTTRARSSSRVGCCSARAPRSRRSRTAWSERLRRRFRGTVSLHSPLHVGVAESADALA